MKLEEIAKLNEWFCFLCKKETHQTRRTTYFCKSHNDDIQRFISSSQEIAELWLDRGTKIHEFTIGLKEFIENPANKGK